MSANVPVPDHATDRRAGGAPDPGEWLVRQGARTEPLAQRLRDVVSGYQHRSSSLGLVQGSMVIQAPAAGAVAAAAGECARVLAGLPMPWSTIELAATAEGMAVPEVFRHLPAAAVLAAGRAAGLVPASRMAPIVPAVYLTLWIAVTLGAIAVLAVGGAPTGAFSPGWRLVYITLAAAVLALVLGWLRRRHAAAQLRRCGEALRASADPSRQLAFAKALAVPALTALPKPVAIVVQDPSRLDALTLEILRQMRQSSGATAIGIVHWIIFTHAGQDPAAAASLVGTTDRAGAAIPAEPPCVLSWRAGTGVPQP